MTQLADQQESIIADHIDGSGLKPLIVIASNRGPFAFKLENDGTTLTHTRGSGGLVTALGALAAKNDVLWVAAALSKADRKWVEQTGDRPTEVDDILVRMVQPTKRSYNQYYNEIANPLLWFVQHEMWNIPRTPSVTRDTWSAWRNGYVTVNRLFAEVIADSVKDTDRPVIVFPQDYHLYLVPKFLRELVGDKVYIQTFCHIPWPGPDAWRILPDEMRSAILTSLLDANRVGFQTEKDAFNFVQCCRFYVKGAHSKGRRDALDYQGRTVHATAYPISVDVEKLQSIAEDPQTRLNKSQLINFTGDQKLILRVDRIEPSKNILRGLEAYRSLLTNHRQYRGKVQMMALLVPSRMEVEQYQDYLQLIMAEAGMINAEFSDAYWEPVRIWVGENYYRAIAALQLYDVLLVNPIADGMNLVAKEGALVNQKDGVLMLSEQAGAFYELGQHALVVSPFDIYGMAEAMHTALQMPEADRRKRAEALRRQVQNNSVKEWFTQQMEDAVAAMELPQSDAKTQAKKSSTS